MKRRLFISAMAVFIAAVLSCTSVVPAFAGASVEGIPVINIEGINSDTLYENIGTHEERAVFVPSQEAILKASARLALPLSRVLIDRDFRRFGDTFIPVAYDIFDPISCNPDGTSKYNVGIKSDMTLPQGYQFDRTLTFNYDWRHDPMSVADDLKAYIDYVKRETGSKEIDLIQTQRSQVSLKIEAELLEKYEELRQRRRGQVIYATENPSCPACGMGMPAGFLSSITSHEGSEPCSNCGMLIYWTGQRV